MQILLKKIFGSKSDREVKKLLPIVLEVNQFAEMLKTKSEDASCKAPLGDFLMIIKNRMFNSTSRKVQKYRITMLCMP